MIEARVYGLGNNLFRVALIPDAPAPNNTLVALNEMMESARLVAALERTCDPAISDVLDTTAAGKPRSPKCP